MSRLSIRVIRIKIGNEAPGEQPHLGPVRASDTDGCAERLQDCGGNFRVACLASWVNQGPANDLVIG